MPLSVSCQVDTSKLNAAIKERLKYPGRTEAQAVNTSAFYLSKRVAERIPFVEQETIDQELGFVKEVQFKELVFGKKGKLKEKIRKSKNLIGMGESRTEGVPLAVLIIAARANQNSHYNDITHGRYAIERNPFKGVSRAEGAQAMRAAIIRMIKARHSSTHYLKAAWVNILSILKGHAKTGEGYSSTSISSAGWSSGKLGHAIPAQEGDSKVECVLIDDTGMDGINGESANRAMWVNVAPIVQQEVDREASMMIKHIEDVLKVRDALFNNMAK